LENTMVHNDEKDERERERTREVARPSRWIENPPTCPQKTGLSSWQVGREGGIHPALSSFLAISPSEHAIATERGRL
jgi:hypothetical protein